MTIGHHGRPYLINEVLQVDLVLTDNEISGLLAVPKMVVNPRARVKEQRGSLQLNYAVQSLAAEAEFEVFVRQSLRDPQGFSCGLIYVPRSSERVTLMRCNGGNHLHINSLENFESIGKCCHIHIATERYMAAGRKPDHYAQPTQLFGEVHGALRTLIEKCNIDGLPSGNKMDPLNFLSQFSETNND